MCEIDADEFSTADVWRERKQRARSVYRCDDCDGTIAVGETYLYHFSACSRDTATGRVCAACLVARDAFVAEHQFTPFPGSLEPFLAQCIDEEPGMSSRRWRRHLAALLERRPPRC